MYKIQTPVVVYFWMCKRKTRKGITEEVPVSGTHGRDLSLQTSLTWYRVGVSVQFETTPGWFCEWQLLA